MTAFERVDPGGDLNTGKSMFYISDHASNQVELSQQEAKELMGDTDFYDPLLMRAVLPGLRLQVMVHCSCSKDSLHPLEATFFVPDNTARICKPS